MKLNSLQSLRELQSVGSVPTIKPLNYKRVTIDRSLSQIELLNYSSSLCLFAMRLLHDEIQVQNKDRKLQTVIKEISKLNNLLHKDDYYIHLEYTHKNTKKFFKEIGLKPRHVDTDRIRRELLKTI